MRDLRQIRSLLVESLRDEGKLALVSARLILRTGVSITEPRPEHVQSPAAIAKVKLALTEMGFDLDALSKHSKGKE
ncbi:MAG TPA: hypothetical protein VF331_19100 [Polyangiales bacterium]|jgi:hypothetical protein